MALAVGAASYIRNVARSLKYSTVDILKDNTPYLNKLFQESKETVSDLYASIKDFRDQRGSEIKALGKESFDNLLKNFKEDLRTGNFYNKERDDILNNEMAKNLLGIDMDDFSFDFDEDDFTFGDPDDDITDGDELILKQSAKNTTATILAVDKVGARVTNGINQGTLASAKYVVNSNRAMTQAMFSLNSKGFAAVTEAVATLNKNTMALTETIAKPLTTYMQNGTLFMTRTTEALDKMVKLMEDMSNRMPNYGSGKKGSSSSSSRPTSLADIAIGGELSISAYRDLVKGNIKEWTDIFSSFGLGKSGKGKLSDITKGISPLRWLPKLVMNSIIPETLKFTVKAFDESLQEFLPSLIAREMKKPGKGGFWGIIRSLFLPQDNFNSKVRAGGYQKGPIPFDGETKQAITYVIPMYLSSILSSLNGGESTHYDYASGRFIKRSDIQKRESDRIAAAAVSGGGNLRYDALEKAGTNKKLQAEIESVFIKAIVDGDFDISTILDPGFKHSELGKSLSKETLAIFEDLIRANKYSVKLRNGKVRKYGGRYLSVPGSVMMARTELTREADRRTATGHDLEVALNDNSLGLVSKAVGGVDKYGNSTLDYLRGIYINTMGGGGGRGRRKGSPTSPVDMPSLKGIQNATSTPTSKIGKATNRDEVDWNNPEDVAAWDEKIRAKEARYKAEKQRYKRNNSKISSTPEYRQALAAYDSKINAAKAEYIRHGSKAASETEDWLSGMDDYRMEKLEGTKNLIKKLFNRVMPEPVLDFFDKPITAVSNLLMTLTDSMQSIIWGDDKGHLGILEYTKSKIDEFIENSPRLKKFIDGLFGEKDETTGKRPGLWTETKKALGEYWSWMKSGFRYRPTRDDESPSGGQFMEFNLPSANGRRITKSGMVSVSEGEMIIPAEFNPFYRGVIDKKRQYRTELRNMKNFYGLYKDGTPAVGAYDQDDIATYKTPDQVDKIINNYNSKSNSKNSMLDGLLKKYNPRGNRLKIKGKLFFRDPDGTWHNSEAGSTGRLLSDTIEGAKGIVTNSIKSLASNVDEKTKENIGKFVDQLSPDLKVARGRIGAGAILGMGFGGVLGSPLLGALVGSVAGFVSKSEAAQKMLFGERDENGERTGGLLSKDMSNFLEKIAPDMAKGGMIGTVAGAALLGGPLGMVGGLVAGTAIGFARKSSKVQEFLFGKGKEGDEDYKKGLIDKEKLKAALPKGLLGAVGGLVLGPVGGSGGLLINMMLGAGIGFLTTNQKVHEFLFGDGKDGKKLGLMNRVRETLLGGINDLFRNTAIHVSTTLKNVGKNLMMHIRNFGDWIVKNRKRSQALNRVQKTPLRKVGEFLRKTLGVTGAGVGLGLLAPLWAPFLPAIAGGGLLYGAPKALARVRKNRNARRGENIYDYKTDENGNILRDENGRKIKGVLSAAERVRYRKQHKVFGSTVGPSTRVTGVNWQDFDTSLADSTTEELRTIRDALAESDDESREMKHISNLAADAVYDVADNNLNSAQLNKLVSMAKSGASDEEIVKYLGGPEIGMTKPQIEAYMKTISPAVAKVRDTKTKLSENREKIKKKFGFNIKNKKDLTKARDLLDQELKTKDPQKEFQDQVKEDTKSLKENIADLVSGKATIKVEMAGKDAGADDSYLLDTLNTMEGSKKLSKAERRDFMMHKDDPEYLRNRFGYLIGNGTAESAKFATKRLEWERKQATEEHPDKEDVVDGKVVVYKWNKMTHQYEIDQDSTSKDAIKELDEKEQVDDAAKETPKALGKIASGFEHFKEMLFGKNKKGKEEKESFLDRLKNFGKKVLFLGGTVFGVGLVPALLPLIGKAFSWLAENGPKLWDWLKTTGKDIALGIWNILKTVGSNIIEILSYLNPNKGAYTTPTGETSKDDIDKSMDENFNKLISDDKSFATKLETGKEKLSRVDIIDDNIESIKLTNPGDAVSVGVKDDLGKTKMTVYKHNWGGPTQFIAASTATYYYVEPKYGYKGLIFKFGDSWKTVLEVSKSRFDEFLQLYNTNISFKSEVDFYITASNGKWTGRQANMKIQGKEAPGLLTLIDLYEKNPSRNFIADNTGTTIKVKSDDGLFGKSYNLTLDENGNLVGDSSHGGGHGFGSGLYGKGSGFVSQRDPKYAHSRFGTSNVYEAGCAPAVASMVAQSYGRNLSMGSAMREAAPYTSGAGTDASYFGSALGKQGIHTAYADRSTMINDLAHGRPTVLLGEDPYNTSKYNSPFKNPHFVVGKGFDSSGNVIVDDPELFGTTTYSPSILNSVTTAIRTGRGSGVYSHDNGGNTEELPDNETTKAIFKWLITKGYSPAAAAGIMGNMWQESRMKPAAIQKNGQGPAAGIVQWENYNNWKADPQSGGSRFGGMARRAAKNGKDWTDLEQQLEYMDWELSQPDMLRRFSLSSTQYRDAFLNEFKKFGLSEQDATTFDQFKQINDAAKATRYFCSVFERCNQSDSNIEGRIKAAQGYASLYSGDATVNSPLSGVSSVNLTNGSANRIVSSNFDQTKGAYYTIVEDRFGKKTGKYTKSKCPVGPVKITSSEFVQSKGMYRIIYNDGSAYWCKNKDGIEAAYEDEAGHYTIKYADGSIEKVMSKPSNTTNIVAYGTGGDGSNNTSTDADASNESTSNSQPGILQKILSIFSTGLNTIISGGNVKEALSKLTDGWTASGDWGSSSLSRDSLYGTSASYIPMMDPNAIQSQDAQTKINAMMDYMKSIENTETYSNDLRDNKGYSDCSSLASRVYKNYLGVNIGSHTASQWPNLKSGSVNNMKLVSYNPGNYSSELSKLKYGDLVYFYNKNYRGGTADDVSHVEMYLGDGKVIGQNAGGPNRTGPSIKNLSSMTSTSIWNGSPSNKSSEKVSSYNRYLGAARYVGSGSGLPSLSSNAYTNLISNASRPSTVNRRNVNNFIAVGKGSSKSDGLLEQLVAQILNLLVTFMDKNATIDTNNLATIKASTDSLPVIADLLGKFKEYKRAQASNEGTSGEISQSTMAVVEQLNAMVSRETA